MTLCNATSVSLLLILVVSMIWLGSGRWCSSARSASLRSRSMGRR